MPMANPSRTRSSATSPSCPISPKAAPKLRRKKGLDRATALEKVPVPGMGLVKVPVKVPETMARRKRPKICLNS